MKISNGIQVVSHKFNPLLVRDLGYVKGGMSSGIAKIQLKFKFSTDFVWRKSQQLRVSRSGEDLPVIFRLIAADATFHIFHINELLLQPQHLLK